jgi:hypothetical protein
MYSLGVRSNSQDPGVLADQVLVVAVGGYFQKSGGVEILGVGSKVPYRLSQLQRNFEFGDLL